MAISDFSLYIFVGSSHFQSAVSHVYAEVLRRLCWHFPLQMFPQKQVETTSRQDLATCDKRIEHIKADEI